MFMLITSLLLNLSSNASIKTSEILSSLMEASVYNMLFNLFSVFWLEKSACFGPNKAGLATKIKISQEVML